MFAKSNICSLNNMFTNTKEKQNSNIGNQKKTQKGRGLFNFLSKKKIKNQNRYSSSSQINPTTSENIYQQLNNISNIPKPKSLTNKIKLYLKHKFDNLLHFHFKSWPDQGVPNSDSLLPFIVEIFEDIEKRGGGTVIHCSAGIGRTGTLYVILAVIFDILYIHEKIPEDLDQIIYNKAVITRLHRIGMIQTPDQYLLIAKIILLFFYKYYDPKQYTNFYQIYNEKQVLNNNSLIEKSLDYYDKLELEVGINFMKKNLLSINELSPEPRYKNILPYANNFIKVEGKPYEASYLPTFMVNKNKLLVIATSCPNPNNFTNFKNMITQKYNDKLILSEQIPKNQQLQKLITGDQTINRIIMLTNFCEKRKKKCDKYYDDNVKRLLVSENYDIIKNPKLYDSDHKYQELQC